MNDASWTAGAQLGERLAVASAGRDDDRFAQLVTQIVGLPADELRAAVVTLAIAAGTSPGARAGASILARKGTQ